MRAILILIHIETPYALQKYQEARCGKVLVPIDENKKTRHIVDYHIKTIIRRVLLKNYANNNKPKRAESQRVLVDKNERGKVYPWQVYKQTALLLAKAMSLREDFFSKSAVERVEKCASFLAFLECSKHKHHPKKLIKATFCKNRLCVGCQMRRSLKCFATTTKIVHYILNQHSKTQFIFLTLTVPNVPIDELNNTVDHMFKSWSKLTKRRGVKRVIDGYLRCLEISFNHERNDYHPHFHVLIAVKKSYFQGKYYINRNDWLELWQESTQQPEITQVDVRKVKSNNEDDLLKACAEIAKYSTKTWSTASKKSNRQFMNGQMELDFGVEGHLWIREDAEKTADTVVELASILKGRRLLQYGGLMRDAKKFLKLQDGEDEGADLINTSETETGCKCPVCAGDMQETEYLWNKHVGDYAKHRSSPFNSVPVDRF